MSSRILAPPSGRAFHVAFATQAQEAFLEGHVLAFEYFGGVPGRIRYDNLKPAVIRVLGGRDRAGAERFVALRSTYGFESFFCIPGPDGAQEKGGVEGEIGPGGQPAVQPAGSRIPRPRLAAAIVDRVTYNAHILKTGTQSCRLAASKTTRPASQRTRGHNS